MWKDTREKRDMAMEQIGWSPSIIVVCYVSLALSVTEFPTLSGILMCKEKCLNTKGCERLAYSSLTFTCYLQGDVIPSFETDLHKMNISRDDLIQTGASCRPGDRIIRSRQGIISCVSVVKSRSIIKTTKDQGKASRLLFKEAFNSWSGIKQVDLRQDKLSIQPYWNTNQLHVISLLYSRFTNSVYIGYYKTYFDKCEISVSKLDSFRNERLIRVNTIGCMGLDEKRDWILMSEKVFKGVFKIVGENRTRMFKTSRLDPISIAICSESQIIYLFTGKHIYTFTYSGKRNCILGSEAGSKMCLDGQGKFLYFSSLVENCIFRYNTVTKKTDTFISFQSVPVVRYIAVDSESLYVKFDKLIVYALSTRRVTREIRGISDRQYHICLVF